MVLGHVLLTHLVELFINSVLYHRHVYPDGIFRKRRAYSTFAFVTIFPPLATYLRHILRVCQELIKEGTLNVLEVVLVLNAEELECHELKINQVKLDLEDNSLELEERIKQLLMRLEAKFQGLKKLPENTSFRINIHTTFGSLKNINQNTSYQVRVEDRIEIRDYYGN